MAINNDAKEALSFALDSICQSEAGEKSAFDERAKNLLAYSLDPDGVDVFDAMVGNFDKKPKKTGKKGTMVGSEMCLAEDPLKCRNHGLAARAFKQVEIEREDKLNRINPDPKAEKRRYMSLLSKLKSAKAAIAPPDNPADTDSIMDDIESLCKEANIKDYKKRPKFEEYQQCWADYRNLVDAAEKESEDADRRLDKGEYDGLEDSISLLKGRGKQIDEAYEKIIDTLQSLYDDLCSEVERSEKGLGIGGLRETEKEQFAPLWGEDGATYQARMKKVGRGREIPETIKRIDEMVAQAEKRWLRVAAIPPKEFETVKENWRKTVHNLMQHTSLATNSYPEGINGVLVEHLKSQHELTPKGKAFENPHPESGIWRIIGGEEESPRYRFTRNVFGTTKGMGEEHYEKYGCLHSKAPTSIDNATGRQYGRNVIRWKPESVCATMFCGDSVCLSRDGLNYCTCSLVSDPSPVSFNPENRHIIDALKKGPMNPGLQAMCGMFGTPYIEIQLHGANRPNAEDIESISFNSLDDVAMLSPDAIARIHDLDIPTYIRENEVRINEDGKVEAVGRKGIA